GRTEIDLQAEGPQGVTVEDTFSMVHISHGQLKPRSPHLRSEPAIIAGMAKATLGDHPIDWDWVIGDYKRIRDLIADTIPGFEQFNTRLQQPGGFHLGNPAAERQWHTATGKAQFTPSELPAQLVNETVLERGERPDLILQTLRSHDQYNTTLYGLDDRYRGVFGLREVVFVNEADIRRLGFEPGEHVDMVSLWEDGRERRVSGFRLVPYDLPEGQAAAYYPETNPLVPLESYGDRTFTPTSKFIAITLEKSRPDNLIHTVAE
ncbi:CbbBc protein, partial [Pseudomonas sp. HLMP]